jgi:hypothetical protein
MLTIQEKKDKLLSELVATHCFLDKKYVHDNLLNKERQYTINEYCDYRMALCIPSYMAKDEIIELALETLMNDYQEYLAKVNTREIGE